MPFQRKRGKKAPRIGLALGAGAARGAAHLGVLEALEETGIEVHCVAGTSIGSLVGAVFASGNTARLREAMQHMEWSDVLSYFFEISIPRSGLIDGKRVADFIGQYVAHLDIEDLPVPFRAVSTDVETGEEVVLDRGPVIEAVRASISVPGIFTPVLHGDRVLVDGGLVNPVPVSVARDMGADLVIAVDINHDRVGSRRRAKARDHEAETRPRAAARPIEDAEWHERLKARLNDRLGELDSRVKQQIRRWIDRDPAPSIFDVIGNTIRIMEARIADSMLASTKPEVLIRPEVGYIGFMEFNHAADAIQAGYEAALPLLRDLKARL